MGKVIDIQTGKSITAGSGYVEAVFTKLFSHGYVIDFEAPDNPIAIRIVAKAPDRCKAYLYKTNVGLNIPASNHNHSFTTKANPCGTVNCTAVDTIGTPSSAPLAIVCGILADTEVNWTAIGF